MALTMTKTINKDSLATKVKNVAETVGTIKGMYDTAKVLYGVGRTIAPIIAGFL